MIISNSVVKLLAFTCLLSLLSINAEAALRFLGNAHNDDHRVKIQIDALPPNSDPGPPADIGNEDFTLEFWMKATSVNNPINSGLPCGANYDWIWGNIIIDRDRYNQGRAFGISVDNGRLRFGTMNATFAAYTICGTSNVLNNEWHHVAVQRRRSDGWMQLFVNGELEAQGDGPDGDISYPDDGVPGNYCDGRLCDFSDPFLVIGVEKHDVAEDYNGLITELRLSNILRYPATVVKQAFVSDSNTMALYHFDEGSGTTANDTSGAMGGPSHGEIKTGVLWSVDSPFSNTANPGTIQFSVASANISENEGSRSFTVTRNGGIGAVSVAYTITAGTAIIDTDYQLTQQTATGILSWADGDTSPRSLSVDIINDNNQENDKTVLLNLSQATGGAILGIDQAILTILDDDSAGSVEFTASRRSVDEHSGLIMIEISRINGNAGPITVDYNIAAQSTASAEIDYEITQGLEGTINFGNGENSANIGMRIIDDNLIESAETLVLTLSNAGNGASLANQTSMTLIINDNDAEPNTGSGSMGLVFLFFLLCTQLKLKSNRPQ